MPREYEVKILNVDPGEFGRSLLHHGASLVAPRALYRRWNFTGPGFGDTQWVRLRTSDDGSGMVTFKHIVGSGLGDVIEEETPVGDPDTMRTILAHLGHSPQRYQENYRTRYVLPTEHGPVNVDVDEWPRVPPWAEIEGHDAATVLAALRLLGIDDADYTTATAVDVYAQHDIDVQAIRSLTFEKTPA